MRKQKLNVVFIPTEEVVGSYSSDLVAIQSILSREESDTRKYGKFSMSNYDVVNSKGKSIIYKR